MSKIHRQNYVELATSMAGLLVDRLSLHGENNSDNETKKCADLKQRSLIQAIDIKTEHFMLEISVDDFSNTSFSAGEILSSKDFVDVYNLGQIKSILHGILGIELVPEIRDKGLIESNRCLQPEYFQQFGNIFFELFTNGKTLPGEASSGKDHCLDSAEESKDESSRDNSNDGDYKHSRALEGARKHGDMSETCKAFKRLEITEVEYTLRQKLLPTPICILVTDLIQATRGTSNDAFETLGDLSLELKQMMESPDVYLTEESVGEHKLQFRDDLLCGRMDELDRLMQVAALAQVESRAFLSSVVLVRGEPGAGKSHLVQNMKHPLTKNGWLYINCNFDRLAQSQALATISSAFEDFFRSLVESKTYIENRDHAEDGDEFLFTMLASIEENLEVSGIVVLSQFIPSLRSLYPNIFQRVVVEELSESDCEQDDWDNANILDSSKSSSIDCIDDDCDDDDAFIDANIFQNRLQYLFQKLLRAISNPESPLFFFLDDLQWADCSSLRLLSSLVMGQDTDDNPMCVCFVGSYRSSEANINQSLVECIQSFEDSNAVLLTSISLDGLAKEGTCAMISSALKLPARLVRNLADVVHMKTLGNPLFVRTLLASMVDDQSLSYSFMTRRWMWDSKAIKLASLPENIAIILIQKLRRMPREVQEALSIAACFGLVVDKECLKILSESSEFGGLLPHLDYAAQSGIVADHGSNYVFTHDLVQKAAYDLIPEESLDKTHFSLGLQIITPYSNERSTDELQLTSTTFIAIEQIIASRCREIPNPTFRAPLADFLVKAGERSIEMADFPLALKYITYGLDFLGGDEAWGSNFRLSLRLHEAACLACYLNVMPRQVMTFVGKIMENTDSFVDRIKAFYVLTKTLASLGKIKEAVEKIFHILEQLGEEIPNDITPDGIMFVMESTKQLLSRFSREKLLNAPKMTDYKKLWTLRFYDLSAPYLFLVNPTYVPLVECRMAQLSVRYGLCKESAFGLFGYAQCLIQIYQDLDGAHRWTKMARLVLERFNATNMFPKLTCLQYSFVNVWVEPFQATIETMDQCSQDALKIGNVEFAYYSAQFLCIEMALTGSHLEIVERKCVTVSSNMALWKQLHAFMGHLSTHLMILKLGSIDKNPFDIPGVSIKDEDQLLEQSVDRRKTLAQAIYFNRMFVAFYLQQYVYAAEMAEQYKLQRAMIMRFEDIHHSFYEALIGFQLARSPSIDTKKWLDIAEQHVATFRGWIKHSKWNFENKLLLLEAELCLLKGATESSEEKYKAAIESARRHKFVHEEGVAWELLSSYWKKCGKVKEERECKKAAFDCYEKWGAKALLDRLRT